MSKWYKPASAFDKEGLISERDMDPDSDDGDDEGSNVFIPSKMDEERHFTPRVSVRKPINKTKKKALIVGGSVIAGCVLLLVVAIVITVVVVEVAPRYSAVPTTSVPTTGTSPTSTLPNATTSPTTIIPQKAWWKTTVIYQCYPRSYQDSDSDGSGDLAGIIRRVGYLYNIGIKTVWLNPIFKSPQRDNGYDISNYTDVDPLFGSLTQLKALLTELHARGMHLLLDFVPNHTSDEHPWFVESRQNRSNSKRDWYVWADGKGNGTPPNNWISVFGGSAWTYDNQTDQYYLHQFSEFQPDLNYSNPEVRKAFEDVLRFWLEIGVDGFRIDAVVHLLEDPQLRDEPLISNASPDCNNYGCLNHIYTRNYQGIHDVIRGWRSVINTYTQTTGRERFIVGEVYESIDTVMSYYGTNNDEFNFPFNFFLLEINQNWTGTNVNQLVNSWLSHMPEGGWPNWVLGNHDNNRIASKAGYYLARALNVLLLTLPGTPTTYYGEEILMTDVNVTADQRQDLYGDRDLERTPMQWTNEPNAGFTTGTPWLPLAENYSVVNVKVENASSTSMLSLYTRLVHLRSNSEAFRVFNISQ